MKNKTSFEKAKFRSEPPQFFGTKIHEGTVWRGVVWPPTPATAGEAGSFVDAYERLKLEMDKLKKHEDELKFFALELQARRVLQGNLSGLPIMLYGLLSNCRPPRLGQQIPYDAFSLSPVTVVARVLASQRGIFQYRAAEVDLKVCA
jgi:hypothetical protein